MSWDFTTTGTGKEAVVSGFVKNVKSGPQSMHIPENCQTALIDCAERLADEMSTDTLKSIRTFGHMNADSTGNMSISIEA